MSDELKQKTFSEIRGVRAFWVYLLIDLFGNAPLATDFGTTETPSITSRADLFKFVLSELSEIKDNLPAETTAATYGKFTQGAAYTLLAKCI